MKLWGCGMLKPCGGNEKFNLEGKFQGKSPFKQIETDERIILKEVFPV
jgi:hypothetical protein